MEGQSGFGVESFMDSSVLYSPLSTPDLSPEGWREELEWVWENGQVSMSRYRETPQGMQQPRVSCVVLTLGTRTLQWSIRAAVRIYSNKRLNETASKTSSNAHMGEGSSGYCDERHFCPH